MEGGFSILYTELRSGFNLNRSNSLMAVPVTRGIGSRDDRNSRRRIQKNPFLTKYYVRKEVHNSPREYIGQKKRREMIKTVSGVLINRTDVPATDSPNVMPG